MEKIRTLPFIFLIIAAACSMLVEVDFDLKTFEQELQAWNNAKIAKYEYTYKSFGFISNKYKVKVEGDKCEITDEYTGETSLDVDYRIENIFGKIKTIYDKSQGAQINKCDNYFYYSRIDVEYDNVNHIPLSIKYTYEVPENFVVDGDFYYEIENFKILTD